jgi:acid stress-induced BolA-like protein IbaG/YrbA
MHNREVNINPATAEKGQIMKNGQLWLNINTERVERVVGELNKIRVFTVGHGYTDMKAVKKQHLVKANDVQVYDYLEEGRQLRKAKLMASSKPELPPLPTPHSNREVQYG